MLDRTKEPGGIGEPLYLDVVAALSEAAADGRLPIGRDAARHRRPLRAVVQGVHAGHGQGRLRRADRGERPKNHFTVGIIDDVTHTSLAYDAVFSIEPDDVVRAVFYGLGADGTVGANKNSIKIIGEETDNYAQGYFVYDSKKSGLADGLAPALRPAADPLGVPDQPGQLRRLPPVRLPRAASTCSPRRRPGAIFLLNSPYGPDEVWDRLPRAVQEQIIAKQLRFYVIDGDEVARETGMGGRINTIMQTCFFAISRRPAARGGDRADQEVDREDLRQEGRGGGRARTSPRSTHTLAHLHEVEVPDGSRATCGVRPAGTARGARVRAERDGHDDGRKGRSAAGQRPSRWTAPARPARRRWEKRDIALRVPVWDPKICIQCGKCAFVCPHAAIRAKVYDREHLAGRPATASSPRRIDGREFQRQELHDPGRARGLHGLQAVRRGLPGQGQGASRGTRPST